MFTVKRRTNAVTAAVKYALATSLIVSPLTMAEDDNELEKIIVTGQKIDRTLQETPASVAVITNKVLEEQKLNNLYDALSVVPNVTGEVGVGGFTIRGIDSFNVSGGGNSFLTSVYVDGAPLPMREIQQGGFSTWDVSQVEVLRGPQSTLQGRNALAGAIVVNTYDPAYEYSAKGRVILGENGQQELAFAAGGSLVDDVLAFRFTAEDRDFDGIIENIARENENSDFSNSNLYRFKLLFEPIEDFSAILSYSKSETEMGVVWADAHPSYANDYRKVNFNDPTWEFTDSDLVVLNLDYYINDIWSATAITTYSDMQYGYEWDGDASPLPIAQLHDKRSDETLTQELKLTFEYDNLKGIIGAYYSNLEVKDKAIGNRSASFNQLGVPTLLVAAPENGGLGLPQAIADQVLALYAPVDPVLLDTYSNLYREITNTAVFVDFTYSINDQFDVFAGIRWDQEKQANATEQAYGIGNAHLLPNPSDYAANPMFAQLVAGINAKLLNMASQASQNEPLTSKTFNEVLPKLGASYHLTDNITTSFTYQQGYRSGGVGTNSARATLFTYDPEFTDNYELSLRSTWLDGTLVTNANVFYLDWQDQQVSVQLSGNQYDRETTNAGKSTVQGFEFELFYYPTNNLTLSAGFGRAKTEFEEFLVAIPGEPTLDLKGQPFADSPEWTANLAASYHTDFGLYLSADTNYQDSALADTMYQNSNEMKNLWGENYVPQNDARTLINARVGYQWENYDIQLSAKNLTDKVYDARGARTNNKTLGQPRQLSLSFTASF